MAVIDNSTPNTLISGTSGADSIRNGQSKTIGDEGNNVTILSGDGNDTIFNGASASLTAIDAGAGNDSIYNDGSNSTILSGDGNDSIDNFDWAPFTVIDTGYGADMVRNSADFVTINVGDSNNFEFVFKNFFIDGVIINNYIDNTGSHVNINAGSANDYIGHAGLHDDSYPYSGEQVTINAGGGNDVIFHSGHYATINGGEGNDRIHINDYRPSNYVVIQYADGDGKDVIYGYTSTNTIQIAREYTLSTMNSDILITAGDGSMLLKDAVGMEINIVTIAGGANSSVPISGQYVNNSLDNQNITTGDGKDTITNSGKDVIINSNNGNDTINNSGTQVTINAGDGNNSIGNNGLQTTIISGNGNDDIYNIGSQSSINSGSGNDYITNDGYAKSLTQVTVNAGDGSDTVNNEFTSEVIINAGSGDDYVDNYYSSKITIDAGDGNNSIDNDNGNNVIINSGVGDDTINNKNSSHVIINAGSGNNFITNDNGSYITINAGDGDDSIYNRVVNTHYNINAGNGDNYVFNENDQVTINTGTGNDSIENLSEQPMINTGTGNDYIHDFSDQSTIYAGSGDDTIRHIGAEPVINAGKGNDILNINCDDGIIQYTSGDGFDTIYGYNIYGAKDTIQIAGAEYTTTESGNNVIINVGSGSMTLVDVKGKELFIVTVESGSFDSDNDTLEPLNASLKTVNLTNANKSPYTAPDSIGAIDASQRTRGINITGNSHTNVIIGGKGKDTLTGGAGNDTFVTSAGKDIIMDYAEGDVVSLSGALSKVTVSKSNVLLSVDKVATTLKDAKGKKIAIIDSSGNLSKQTFGEKSISIADGDGQTIDTSLNTTAVTLDASARTEALNLVGNAKANVIQLGSGNSTITTGKGKDTIVANANGNALITDYVVGQDRLKFSVDISNVAIRGSDVVFTLGSGKVTVAGAKDKKITVTDKDGVTTSQVYGATEVKLANADGATIKAIAPTVSLDASKRTKAVTLIANDNGNTLTGGKKNDTLTGGYGADTFVYNNGSGSDIITNYSASQGDIIKLGAKTNVTGLAVSNNDLILSIGKGKLTIQGGATQAVTVIDDNGIEASYKLANARSTSTQGYEERWFLANAELGGASMTQGEGWGTSIEEILEDKADIAVDYKFNDESNFSQSNKTIPLVHNQSKNK